MATEREVLATPLDKRTRFFRSEKVIAVLSLGVGLALGWAVLSLPTPGSGLAGLVQHELPHSGVTNPVTAVLLNFRGYDTLLEIGVLLLAVFGVWSLPGTPALQPPGTASDAGSVLNVFVRLLTPVMIVVGGYFLWAGAHLPGGAFQGGVVLAAAWVLLFLSGVRLSVRVRGWPLRVFLVFGFAFFLGVAAGVITMGGRLLEYPRDWAAALILLVETALTLSIACILASLFMGGLPNGLLDSGTPQAPERQ